MALKKKDKKYAYEKAIEAYWKHVDRYHTWMNYYAIFNGALFVGFCTLLTSTNYIYEIENRYKLDNNYGYLCIILCIMGMVAGLCWYVSILGHERWENNWMNIIDRYEIDNYKVYKLIRSESKYMKFCSESSKKKVLGKELKLTESDEFKAYSTHSITKTFVFFVVLGWTITTIITIINYIKPFMLELLIPISILIILIVFLLNFGFKYSDVKGKYWIEKT